MPSPSFLASLSRRMVGVACVRRMWRAALWTALLTLTVGVTIFAPEAAFVSAVSSSSSSFSRACPGDNYLRIPLDDVPGEVLCIPGSMVGRSKFDSPLPAIFAAIMVAGSAFWLQFLCVWDGERG
ncbi:uncharacterized protein LOC115685781 [Syzygium oleosum]|uniref:uncharacterized protein LOC115685781 n=1 Tax=Syzygium oleosum TaxID=219896 RepID=UPI0024B9A6A1|nr:uncharacterized protein LOC115685781 [Syzygium oleosum]